MLIFRFFSVATSFLLACSLIALTPEQLLERVSWLSGHPIPGGILMDVFAIGLFIGIIFILEPIFEFFFGAREPFSSASHPKPRSKE